MRQQIPPLHAQRGRIKNAPRESKAAPLLTLGIDGCQQGPGHRSLVHLEGLAVVGAAEKCQTNEGTRK